MAATERIIMTMRELDRSKKAIQDVADGKLKPWRVAERLGLTTRQIRRLVGRQRGCAVSFEVTTPSTDSIALPRECLAREHRACEDEQSSRGRRPRVSRRMQATALGRCRTAALGAACRVRPAAVYAFSPGHHGSGSGRIR
ncbi:hypothetical protein [Burkholderia savannae]|uniref:hypothetical protein n=1 Tax=Burkholderia savannae TaxID=1637837 RepID=UPI0009E9FB86